MKFYRENLIYYALIHILGGIGLGIILSRPMATDHPVRWGVGLIIVSLALHLYPLIK